jgi:hypothetical protein
MDILSKIWSLSSGLWSAQLRCNIQKLTKFPSWLERGANNLLMPYKRQGREFDPRRDQFSFLMFFELGCVKPGQA